MTYIYDILPSYREAAIGRQLLLKLYLLLLSYWASARHRMTYAKTAAFTEDQQQLARLAKALAHPARVAIIQFLAAQKTCISGDIAAELPLSRTTVSQHLQELKALDLIRGEVEGLTVCYCLNTELLQRVHQQFTAFFLEATSGGACGPNDACAC